MSVELLMDVLHDINFDKNQKIPSKYLHKKIKKGGSHALTTVKKRKQPRKFPIYYQIIQSGGSSPQSGHYSLDKNIVSERISNIKSALLKMKGSPPPIEIGIFSDTPLHPSDLLDAKRELIDYQKKQQNIKETWTESWMKSKFPIYCKIVTVIIKLIVCCLQCGGNLLWTVLLQWMSENIDIMSDFFLGLLGSLQVHSRYTSLFNNVPIFGPIFRLLFSLFKFIFQEIGDRVSFGLVSMIIRMLYNIILTLRPYYHTIYGYWVVVRQLQSGNSTVYLSLFFSLVTMFFDKNISKIPGLSLIRIPLLQQNLFTVFNEMLNFHKSGYNICQWCTGKTLLKLDPKVEGEEGGEKKNKYEIADFKGDQRDLQIRENYKRVTETPNLNENSYVKKNLTDDGDNTYQQYLFDVNPESMGINSLRRTFNFGKPRNLDGSLVSPPPALKAKDDDIQKDPSGNSLGSDSGAQLGSSSEQLDKPQGGNNDSKITPGESNLLSDFYEMASDGITNSLDGIKDYGTGLIERVPSFENIRGTVFSSQSPSSEGSSSNLDRPEYGNWFPSGERVGELGKSYQTWVGEKVMDAASGLSNTASDVYGAGTGWFEGVGRGFSGQSDTTPTYSREGRSRQSDQVSTAVVPYIMPGTDVRYPDKFISVDTSRLQYPKGYIKRGGSIKRRTRGRKKNVSRSKSFKKHLHSKKNKKKMGSKTKQTKVNIR